MFSPVLRKLGYGLSWRNAVVLTWGGLRGAVGLAMALIVVQTKEINFATIGSKVLFHTSGIVVLTLLVNATTIKSLLSILGEKRLLFGFCSTHVRKLYSWGDVLLSQVDRLCNISHLHGNEMSKVCSICIPWLVQFGCSYISDMSALHIASWIHTSGYISLNCILLMTHFLCLCLV